MSTTYTWTVTKVGTKDEVNSANEVLADSIVYVQWKKVGTDIGGNSAAYVGETKLSASDVSASNFVAFEDVDSSTVIDWVEASLTAEQMAKIDAVIEKKIADKQITFRDLAN